MHRHLVVVHPLEQFDPITVVAPSVRLITPACALATHTSVVSEYTSVPKVDRRVHAGRWWRAHHPATTTMADPHVDVEVAATQAGAQRTRSRIAARTMQVRG